MKVQLALLTSRSISSLQNTLNYSEEWLWPWSTASMENPFLSMIAPPICSSSYRVSKRKQEVLLCHNFCRRNWLNVTAFGVVWLMLRHSVNILPPSTTQATANGLSWEDPTLAASVPGLSTVHSFLTNTQAQMNLQRLQDTHRNPYKYKKMRERFD